MKKKISILLVIIGLASTGMLMANGAKGGFGFFDRIAEKLSLTDSQKVDIEPIIEKYKAEAEHLSQKDFEDRMEKREAFKDLKNRAEAEILPFLTTDQVAKLKELKERRKGGKSHGHHGKRFKGNKELKAEMKGYFEREVLPIAKQERAKLERVISAEDKATIESLRKRMEYAKEQRMQGKEERKAQREGEKGQSIKDGHRRGHNQMDEKSKAEKKALMTEAKKLTEKYKGDIEPLLKGMKNKYGETWKNDIQEIVKRNAPEMEEHFNESSEKGRMGKPFNRAFSPVGFLLLDSNTRN